jgi:predicted DNA-binding transcriptional regulator YafY
VSAVTDTAGRLRRLLAVLAWLAQVGEAPVDDVAERFDLTADELVRELEMAACCGVPPYTPDQLMEIMVSETTVSVHPGVALARPRRLGPHEGFVLVAAARALLAVPGSDVDGALSRALAKLERALGGETLDVELDAPAHLSVVREAVDNGRSLDLTYYSASSDRLSERRVEPIRLFASEGHWYLDAWCEVAEGLRRFRVDRMVTAAVAARGAADGLGEGRPREHRREGAGTGAFVPGPEEICVRLSIDPAQAWLVESIPASGSPRTVDGRLEVEVFVGGEAWLERLLLRLGPDARVVEPSALGSLGADAAARILERYDDRSGAGAQEGAGST